MRSWSVMVTKSIPASRQARYTSSGSVKHSGAPSRRSSHSSGRSEKRL